jgi:signal transduction histidine kinase
MEGVNEMTALNENSTKKYFVFILCYSVFICLILFVYNFSLTNHIEKIVLKNNISVASYLLNESIPEEIVAKAISSSEESADGKMLIQKIGYIDSPTEISKNSQNKLWISTIAICLLLSATLIVTSVIYIKKRELLYLEANKIINNLARGDFSKHLPGMKEGTIYQLFGSIDNLANALQSQNEAECQVKEFLKKTISDISHQLKTPLTAIGMYNEIILQESGNSILVEKFSNKISMSIERMNQLIQSMLKITRLDAGNIVFEKNQYQVLEVISMAIDQLVVRVNCENKKIKVDILDEDMIICDMQWTSEAIGNIIKNALDYTDTGGTIHITSEQTSTITRISITDNGEGISQEDIFHIFKRFYRSTNSMNKHGIGLGLPLAKAIIEEQGGSISVHSELNKGTTFSIAFLTKM